jgi:hypothetical protein
VVYQVLKPLHYMLLGIVQRLYAFGHCTNFDSSEYAWVADDRTSAFPPSCCCWRGAWHGVWATAAGARPGRCPPPAVWRGAAVLRLRWSPSPCRSSLWTASCCRWGWLVLVRGGGACRAVGGCLQSGAALIDVRLDVGPLPTVSAGCRLGGFLART